MESIFDNGLLVFALILGFIGLVMLIMGLASLQKAKKTEYWRQAKGKVLESDVIKSFGKTSEAQGFRYRYRNL